MRTVSRTARLTLSLALLASPLSAQSISVGLRGTGSFPTGSFAEDPTASNPALIQGAKQGFGYGAELGVGLGLLGAYASFDHIAFDCQTTACHTDGEYTLQGVTIGVMLTPPVMSRFSPFLKGGVTFQELKGGYGGQTSNRITTDRSPGYELGVGADIGLASIVSLRPQLRYIGQNLKANVPGVTNTSTTDNQGVNYFTFDLGLALRTPFGR